MKKVQIARRRSLIKALKKGLLAGVLCLGATLGSSNNSRLEAAQMGFTDLAAYMAATAGRTVTTLNFDAETVGTTISSVAPYQGILFDSANAVTGGLEVTNGDTIDPLGIGINTFSANNFLASNSGFIQESFNFTFQTPVNGVGLYLISSSQLAPGDAGISVGATSLSIDANSIANEITIIGNGKVTSYAYFLGIADTDPLATFSTVTVNPNNTLFGEGIGIDNLSSTVSAVPEPSSILLFSMAGMAFIGYRSRKQNRLFA